MTPEKHSITHAVEKACVQMAHTAETFVLTLSWCMQGYIQSSPINHVSSDQISGEATCEHIKRTVLWQEEQHSLEILLTAMLHDSPARLSAAAGCCAEVMDRTFCVATSTLKAEGELELQPGHQH